ncbi:MAG: Sua5/YciO/YrdC/YwlC family protein [Thermoleophilaceae bacterium]|nr:Sua5/YciO/YrdC/YwlC family protein [Thermoleophilaceae bacterium]
MNSDTGADFQATIENGEIAVFPTDTLYGISCDPDNAEAVERIHELKGRPPKKPSAVMYFSLEHLLADIGDDLDVATLNLVEQLFPGPFTLVVANRGNRFLPACAGTPEKLGLRVPKLGRAIEPLGTVQVPVMQTSANISGAPDATAIEDIDPAILAGVDLVIDGGPLLGYGSTVADVSGLEHGNWQLLRAPMPRTSARISELIGFPPQPEDQAVSPVNVQP